MLVQLGREQVGGVESQKPVGRQVVVLACGRKSVGQLHDTLVPTAISGSGDGLGTAEVGPGGEQVADTHEGGLPSQTPALVQVVLVLPSSLQPRWQ